MNNTEEFSSLSKLLTLIIVCFKQDDYLPQNYFNIYRLQSKVQSMGQVRKEMTYM